MIRSFRHKGVEKFFRTGNKAGIQAAHSSRLARQLATLNVATQPSDMNLRGNWRLTFTFKDGDAELVDYQDYH